MKKTKSNYICNSCGAVFKKWSGKCSECGQWDTIEEEITPGAEMEVIQRGKSLNVESLEDDIQPTPRISCNIQEFDRVTGGGLVSGSVILLGGEPGIGKSTILLQLAAGLGGRELEVLYVTGEESPEQVKLRARRMQVRGDNLKLVTSNNTSDILATLGEHKNTKMIVVDSIQTMQSSSSSSPPGTASQIRLSAQELSNYAKSRGIILILVGHVTKEGQIAGPKLLEHMVDTVMYFEGDNNSGDGFRLLRAVKNRFGNTGEIGVFEMQDRGLREVANPSELFLQSRDRSLSGVSVFAGIEGSRPMLMEIQALISPSNLATPRRSVVGWDSNRLAMITAVLSVRYGLNLGEYEVYLSVAGGLKISEPAADLAVAAAIISSALNIPLPESSVIFGEIGLSGELRSVSRINERLSEAYKLGFRHFILPSASNKLEKGKFKDCKITSIAHVKDLKKIFS